MAITTREIKFRARYQVDGRWAYKAGLFQPFVPSLRGLIRSETICQYTGLKDANGVEIYEGDIVIHGVIVFIDGCFRLDAGSKVQVPTVLCQDRCKRWKIIGNIHENPELLEVPK